MPPIVSIVTPSLNQSQFIEQTIKSVLIQDYPLIEYIVVDGGSRDGSKEIIQRYHDRISCWIMETDDGQSQAINKGLSQSKGDILQWLNSDDILEPGAVDTVVRTFEENPDVDLVFSDFWDLNESTGARIHCRLGPVGFPELVKCNVIPQPTVFFRRRLWERIGPLDESLHLAMDWEYWLRAARNAKLHYIANTCLATLRDHPGAKTRARYRQRLAEQLAVLDRLYADPTLPASARRNRRLSYGHVYWEGAEAAMLTGRAYPEAVHWLFQSLRMHPWPAMLRPLTTARILRSAAMGRIWGRAKG